MATSFGYTLMTEQSSPKDLVSFAESAESVGFDFLVSSDHYEPWLASQGHAPYAWSVLGAVAHVTDRVELMSYVTCPTLRYHPAVVAQKAATVQLMSDGRFLLGLGTGENLNEHIVGAGWPAVDERHDMLAEAIDIIRNLIAGDRITYVGDHFRVDSAQLWDVPDDGLPLAVAVSGTTSADRFGQMADHMIATDPDAELGRRFDAVRDADAAATRKIGQIPIAWDTDADAAVERAHDQFRWSPGGWQVNANLPTPASFEDATTFVRPDDVAATIPCGSDVDAVVSAVSAYWEAGFTDIALVQVGGEPKNQHAFLDAARAELLDALRQAST